MIGWFPCSPRVAASPSFSLVSTEGWTTRSWFGSSLAWNPLLLSLKILPVPRLRVLPGTFLSGVRRPRPRIFPSAFVRTAPRVCRGRFNCEYARTHLSNFGVSKHQARWSPAKNHLPASQASTNDSHVDGAAFVVDSSRSTRFCHKVAENRWIYVSPFA